jgi:hypothetical protein
LEAFNNSPFITAAREKQEYNFLPRVPTTPLGSSAIDLIFWVGAQVRVTIYTHFSLRASGLFLRGGKSHKGNKVYQQEF